MAKLRIKTVQARRLRWAARSLAAFSVYLASRVGVSVSAQEIAAGMVAFDAVLQLFVTDQMEGS